MRKATIRDLNKAIGEFSALTGRKLRSHMVEKTIAEGEYKSDITSPDDDGLSIPSFLKRQPDEASKAVVKDILDKAEAGRIAGKGKPAKDSKVSERVLTKAELVEALNAIQDHGYVRSEVKQIAENVNINTYVHHARGALKVRVERLAEGYRLIGANLILSEFEVPPGGPVQNGGGASMAMQADGHEENLGQEPPVDQRDNIRKRDPDLWEIMDAVSKGTLSAQEGAKIVAAMKGISLKEARRTTEAWSGMSLPTKNQSFYDDNYMDRHMNGPDQSQPLKTPAPPSQAQSPPTPLNKGSAVQQSVPAGVEEELGDPVKKPPRMSFKR